MKDRDSKTTWTARELYVIQNLYIVPFECKTAADIARELGLSRERLRQIEKAAMRKMLRKYYAEMAAAVEKTNEYPVVEIMLQA